MTARQLLDRVRQLAPDRPLRTFWRSTGYKLRPPRPVPYHARITHRRDGLLAAGRARPDQQAEVLCELRPGRLPTVVVGGFVPDATEALYLQRGMLLRQGSVFYLNYPVDGFSLPLLFAQLDDLVEELSLDRNSAPVLIGVSFGCGVLLEWMRHLRRCDAPLRARGVVFISPVTCPADILEPGATRPTTLLGRALRPFLQHEGGRADQRHVEKSRALLLRMFEAGAQNRRSIRAVMTPGELLHVRHRVMTTLRAITLRGAVERVAALAAMEPPVGYYTQLLAPLCEAPVLILFAEKETSVLTDSAPTLVVLGVHPQALFPTAQVRTVINRRGSPVQHASMLFHCFNFASHLSTFYRLMREHAQLERTRGRPRTLRAWLLPLGRPSPRGKVA